VEIVHSFSVLNTTETIPSPKRNCLEYPFVYI